MREIIRKIVLPLTLVWSFIALCISIAGTVYVVNRISAGSPPSQSASQPQTPSSGDTEGDENMDYISVYDCGAVGDGVADDTEAFRSAVAKAEDSGKAVHIPYGTFKITDTVKVPSVTVYGHMSGSWTADSDMLPTVMMTNPDAPLFEVASGCVAGIKVDCKLPSNLTSAQPTFLLTTAGGQVRNVKISNPFIGIKTDDANTDKYNPGRCVIENVFIVFPIRIGVYVGGTYDVPTLNNIEVWNPATDSYSSQTFAGLGVGFYFAKNDDLRATNLFVYNASTGYLIDADSKLGGFWGSLTNCSADFCSVGIRVKKDIENSDSHLTMSGGTFWGHQSSVLVDEGSKCAISLSGCEFRSNGASTLQVNGGDSLAIAGCVISRVFDQYEAPAVTINGGDSVAMSGNVINSTTDAVILTNKAKGGISITGNVIKTNGEAFVNQYSGNIPPVIANNVTQPLN